MENHIYRAVVVLYIKMLRFRRPTFFIRQIGLFKPEKECPNCTTASLFQTCRFFASKVINSKQVGSTKLKSQSQSVSASAEIKEKKKEERRKERKEIFREIQRGYFADFHEFRRTGGKRFFALDRLFEEKDTVLFPHLKGRTLRRNMVDLQQQFPNHVTLVLMWFRAIGQGMCDRYRLPFMQQFHGQSSVQYYEVNVVDGWFFKLLKPFIERSLRKTKGEGRHDNYLCYFGNTQLIKERLIENVIVGHAFLVDSNGRVRWRAHADPTPEELKYMLECTESLLKESRRKFIRK